MPNHYVMRVFMVCCSWISRYDLHLF